MWNGALWLLLLLLWLDCCVCLLAWWSNRNPHATRTAIELSIRRCCHDDDMWVWPYLFVHCTVHYRPPLHKLTTSRLMQSFELFPPVPRLQRSNYVWFSLRYWQSHLLSIYCPVGTARAGSVSWLSGPISKYKNIFHSIAVRPMWTYQIRG